MRSVKCNPYFKPPKAKYDLERALAFVEQANAA